MRNTFISTLFKAAKINPDIILITGDLGFSVVEEFADKLPKQFINAGIAEQNMTGVAAGLALSGKKVFTYSIANFPTLRCLEQIRNDICYHDANVTIVSVGAGFMYGPQGYTHHGLEDSSILRTLPRMNVCVPANDQETEQALNLIIKSDKPFYLKLGKNIHDVNYGNLVEKEIGQMNQLSNGGDILIVAQGSILEEAIIASEKLRVKGVNISVWSAPWLKPIDDSVIRSAAEQFRLIMTLEEAQKIGGLGSAFAEVLATMINKSNLIVKAVPDIIEHASISQLEARKKFGLDSESIISEVLRHC